MHKPRKNTGGRYVSHHSDADGKGLIGCLMAFVVIALDVLVKSL